MPAIAADAGIAVDSVDSRGQNTMTRPEPDHRVAGPMAAALANRLNGSSRTVDASGDLVTSAAEPVLDARVGGVGA